MYVYSLWACVCLYWGTAACRKCPRSPANSKMCERHRGVVIYEIRGREDVSGLVQNYWPLRVFSFFNLLPLFQLYSIGEMREVETAAPHNGSLTQGWSCRPRQTTRQTESWGWMVSDRKAEFESKQFLEESGSGWGAFCFCVCVRERDAALMRTFMGADVRVRMCKWFMCVSAQCPGMQSSVCLGETDSGLSHVRSSCKYSSEPGERLSEQVNNHIWGTLTHWR